MFQAARASGRKHADRRRHAHVLVAAERDDRSQHRKPQKYHGGELIRPGERAIEDVSCNHAREQDYDLDRNQRRRQKLDAGAKQRVDGAAHGSPQRFLAGIVRNGSLRLNHGA